MAKKKPMFGVNNYHKRTPRKRPGRIRKKMGPGQKRPKKYRGQATNISTKQWNTLLIELNLITKAWKPFATLTLKANGLNKVLTWGTRKGKDLDDSEREWR